MNVEVNPGYKLTEAGVIPEDWEEVLLDSVAKRGSGHTPDKKHPEYWNGSIRWVSLQDSEKLDDLYINDTAAKITPAGINHSSAVLHPAGSVVLSRDAGVGKSAILLHQMAVSQHFMAWYCGQKLDNHFLYYWMQAAKPEFERIANGSTIKTIGLSYFRELKISLPSLVEQRSIALALLDMDALIRGLNQLISKKRDIKQAAMQQLLTGQQRLPGFSGEWDLAVLGSLLTMKATYGIVTAGEFKSSGVPMMRGGDIKGGKIGYDLPFVTHEKSNDYSRTIIKQDDVVISLVGYPGEAAKVPVRLQGANISRAVGLLRLNKLITPDYLVSYLNSPIGRRMVLAPSAGSAQLVVNLMALNKLEFLLPSRPEQTAIASILSDMDSELTTLETRRNKALQLKQGMMQELLTGRIRLSHSSQEATLC